MTTPLMTSFIEDFGSSLPRLLDGLQVSALLTDGGLTLGLPLALAAALAQMSSVRWLQAGAVVFVEVGRGAPALVLLQLAYFGLPNAGIVLPAVLSAITALSWTTAAYGAEYIRSGLAAVPNREIEAVRRSG